MIKSMTGFGRGEASDGYRQFTVEMKSLNHRYNDIIIRMPKHLNYIEDNIKKFIKAKIKRGRVEVYISKENVGENDVFVSHNLPLAKSYKGALNSLSKELDINDSLTLDMISRYPDVLTVERKEEDEDEIWNCLKIALDEALEKLVNMRIDEGIELAKDISDRASKVEELSKNIEIRSPQIVNEYKVKLFNRIEELLEDKYDIDEARLANEVAIFADKSNINEEIVRLKSHVGQLVKTLSSDKVVGRKLDFLIQEMNREANTIGSKISDIETTNNVVEIKSELEKIREQVQNIE